MFILQTTDSLDRNIPRNHDLYKHVVIRDNSERLFIVLNFNTKNRNRVLNFETRWKSYMKWLYFLKQLYFFFKLPTSSVFFVIGCDWANISLNLLIVMDVVWRVLFYVTDYVIWIITRVKVINFCYSGQTTSSDLVINLSKNMLILIIKFILKKTVIKTKCLFLFIN